MDVGHYKNPEVGVAFVLVKASMPVIKHKGEKILGEERVSFSSQFHTTAPSLRKPREPWQGLGDRNSSRDHGGASSTVHMACSVGFLI